MKRTRFLVIPAALALLIFLLLISQAASAQNGGPLPFESISVQGQVEVVPPGPTDEGPMNRLRFDGEFELNEQSDGIGLGDNVTIDTILFYPAPTPQVPSASLSDQLPTFQLQLVKMVLEIKVKGSLGDALCFVPENGGLLFVLTENNEGCVEAILKLIPIPILADVQGCDAVECGGNRIILTDLLRSMRIQLVPEIIAANALRAFNHGGRKWKLMSQAEFDDPEFPFPIAGLGGNGEYGAGTGLIIGNDGGSGNAPFGSVGFRGGEENGEVCEPVDGDLATQGFWRRVCKKPHPSGEHERLPTYVDAINDTATFADVNSVGELCPVLTPTPRNDKCAQAEAQFMALLLNETSGRVAECNTINDAWLGTETVGEAIAAIDALLAAPDRTRDQCTTAQSLAGAINEGEILTAGP